MFSSSVCVRCSNSDVSTWNESKQPEMTSQHSFINTELTQQYQGQNLGLVLSRLALMNYTHCIPRNVEAILKRRQNVEVLGSYNVRICLE
jgi:hypothetical protein